MTNVTYSLANLSNIDEITSLFRNTIQTVNTKDYSSYEIEAWSKGADITDNWIKRIEKQYFALAKINSVLVGMASMEDNGYLDVLYVHNNYQGHGIASSLLTRMIKRALDLGKKVITSDVSITAKPFFLHKGFKIINPQLVLCRGVVLRNYHVKFDIE